VEVQYEIVISGRVQGVGFRFFVQKRAEEFDIAGWVKNMTDGSVVVMARGEEADMNTFLDHVRHGPSMARVENISLNKVPLSDFDRFDVKY